MKNIKLTFNSANTTEKFASYSIKWEVHCLFIVLCKTRTFIFSIQDTLTFNNIWGNSFVLSQVNIIPYWKCGIPGAPRYGNKLISGSFTHALLRVPVNSWLEHCCLLKANISYGFLCWTYIIVCSVITKWKDTRWVRYIVGCWKILICEKENKGNYNTIFIGFLL